MESMNRHFPSAHTSARLTESTVVGGTRDFFGQGRTQVSVINTAIFRSSRELLSPRIGFSVNEPCEWPLRFFVCRSRDYPRYGVSNARKSKEIAVPSDRDRRNVAVDTPTSSLMPWLEVCCNFPRVIESSTSSYDITQSIL